MRNDYDLSIPEYVVVGQQVNEICVSDQIEITFSKKEDALKEIEILKTWCDRAFLYVRVIE